MASEELPQFFTYNQQLGKETPGKAFRSIQDHSNNPELLSDLLSEVLTSFLNNPRGGSLYYGVAVEPMVEHNSADASNWPCGHHREDPAACCPGSHHQSGSRGPPLLKQPKEHHCSCCQTAPRAEECQTDGVGKVVGVPEALAQRPYLQRELEKALARVRPPVTPTCCSISVVPVMNTPEPYAVFYLVVFSLQPPPIPQGLFERIPRGSAAEEHFRLTRKLSDLANAVTDLSKIFREVYEPRYNKTALLENISPEDPRCRLTSLSACNQTQQF